MSMSNRRRWLAERERFLLHWCGSLPTDKPIPFYERRARIEHAWTQLARIDARKSVSNAAIDPQGPRVADGADDG